ncbi:MAG TPA: hypothetical protein VGA36_03525 [Nitriliruptorales bacterium]
MVVLGTVVVAEVTFYVLVHGESGPRWKSCGQRAGDHPGARVERACGGDQRARNARECSSMHDSCPWTVTSPVLSGILPETVGGSMTVQGRTNVLTGAMLPDTEVRGRPLVNEAARIILIAS